MAKKNEEKLWFLKSKTFWGVVLLIIAGIMNMAGMSGDDIVQLVGVALTFLGLRHAIQKSMR